MNWLQKIGASIDDAFASRGMDLNNPLTAGLVGATAGAAVVGAPVAASVVAEVGIGAKAIAGLAAIVAGCGGGSYVIYESHSQSGGIKSSGPCVSDEDAAEEVHKTFALMCNDKGVSFDPPLEVKCIDGHYSVERDSSTFKCNDDL